MTSERVAVVGTGLIGTSIAMAAVRAGCLVSAFDTDPMVLQRAVGRAPTMAASSSLADCVAEATLVVVATPVPATAAAVAEALEASASAIVTDAASIKSHVLHEVERSAGIEVSSRFVGGHPMGGSERSGPEWASPAVVDGAVWVLTPGPNTDADAVDRLTDWVTLVGARPVVMDADRHDRLVAIVSHLPQVASTALMALAATEEAGEPDILLLAAGGFRDLTRLAASSPQLWSEILIANRDAIGEAIDLYTRRLRTLRDMVAAADSADVERTFADAKRARLSLSAKPQVKTGVAVLQVLVPDRPGALADLTASLGTAGVNIEDLQIVHSPEGGRGTVHLTVVASAARAAAETLVRSGFEPVRLA
jgi:prephenate dehydrogenase